MKMNTQLQNQTTRQLPSDLIADVRAYLKETFIQELVNEHFFLEFDAQLVHAYIKTRNLGQ